ncbi:DUF6588 family protein [Saccharicrinis aurantiacus]|uniref:DUF6588 family protein n=1 Tax=Saccharicrinis aurantiacus TaxID=1849719 RepID=UPI0024910318|nr:DUF6588 family protein [Saccharicrinis aurantiacus]
MNKCKLLLLTVVLGAFMTLHAQNLEDFISKYTSENGQKYMQPFADAFSANLNSGLYHNSSIEKWGFQMYIGVVAQSAIIPTKSKYFMAKYDDPSSGLSGEIEAPTVFGPAEGPTVTHPGNGLSYVLPGGFDVDHMPLLMPQLTIGSVYGTDLTIRYTKMNIEDAGELDVFGWGIRHSINNYLDSIPVDIAIGYYNQYFKVGEYLDASSNIISLQCSYNTSFVTFYGGLSYETGKVKVQYDYSGIEPEVNSESTEPGDKVEFDMDAANTIRATLGITLNMGPFKVNGDYNFAKQNTVNVGIGFGINERERYRKSKELK